MNIISVGIAPSRLESLELRADIYTRGNKVELRHGNKSYLLTYVLETNGNRRCEEFTSIRDGDEIIINSVDITAQDIYQLNNMGVGIICINMDNSVSVYKEIPNSKKEKEEEKLSIKEESDRLVEQLADHFSEWMYQILIDHEYDQNGEHRVYFDRQSSRQILSSKWKSISVDRIESSIKELQEDASIIRLNYNAKQRDLIQLKLLVNKYIGDGSDECE